MYPLQFVWYIIQFFQEFDAIDIEHIFIEINADTINNVIESNNRRPNENIVPVKLI